MTTELPTLDSTTSDSPQALKSMGLLIGNTPLIRLGRIGKGRCPIFVKMESLNPSGSVRDRYIAEIVERAFTAQQLRSGDEIALAGINDSAVSAAFVASNLGLSATIFAPVSSSQRLVPLIERYGAKIRWTEDAKGLEGAVLEAAAWARKGFNRLYVDGYRQQAVKESYRNIAMEIIDALNGCSLGGFVTSVTTGGTFREVSRVLRSVQVNLEVRGARLVENEFATAEENPFIRPVNLKEIWDLRDQISAEEGLLLGPKGAACMKLALELEDELPPGRAIVALNPDAGQRYLGWEDIELFKATFVPN